jgi:hypothetical protein
MNSNLNPGQTDPRDVARATEQIVRALNPKQTDQPDVQRANENLSKLKHAAERRTSDPQRPAGPGDRPSSRRAVRGLIGLLLAAFIGVAAIAWQSSYGGAAKQIIASWAPQLVPSSSLPLENPVQPAQPSPPAVQAAAAKTAPAQPALLAQSAPEDVAPTTALPPELKQLLQSMARDLATLGQGIEQLKASQEQMAHDNAKAAEQLKASHEQMAYVIAKASEQNLRPKIAPPPRPTATPTRRPVPTP